MQPPYPSGLGNWTGCNKFATQILTSPLKFVINEKSEALRLPFSKLLDADVSQWHININSIITSRHASKSHHCGRCHEGKVILLVERANFSLETSLNSFNKEVEHIKSSKQRKTTAKYLHFFSCFRHDRLSFTTFNFRGYRIVFSHYLLKAVYCYCVHHLACCVLEIWCESQQFVPVKGCVWRKKHCSCRFNSSPVNLSEFLLRFRNQMNCLFYLRTTCCGTNSFSYSRSFAFITLDPNLHYKTKTNKKYH